MAAIYYIALIHNYEKVLEGGIMNTEPDHTLDILKADLEERPKINGRRLTISVMDSSVLMIFSDRPTLDNSLPYVNIFNSNLTFSSTFIKNRYVLCTLMKTILQIPIYTHLRLRPLEIVPALKVPSLLHKQKELL